MRVRVLRQRRGAGGDGHRHRGGHRLSHGRHHRLFVPHRLRVRAHDRRADRGLLHPEKSRFFQDFVQYPKSDYLADRLCFVPHSYACGYAGRKHSAGYGDHDHHLPDRKRSMQSGKQTEVTFIFALSAGKNVKLFHQQLYIELQKEKRGHKI